MIEWSFILVLHLTSLCDTDLCTTRHGVTNVNVRAVDEAHCRKIRKTIMRRLGAAEFTIVEDDFSWPGEHGNPGGSISRCTEQARPPAAGMEEL